MRWRKDDIRSLISRMPRRCQAVIDARGSPYTLLSDPCCVYNVYNRKGVVSHISHLAVIIAMNTLEYCAGILFSGLWISLAGH
ncbi:hypothetical protein Avbf_09452 [Armadillidium vulgare]|nr:hypothetical protein Avbf_09452 [Armadillidium vulgare]